MERMTEKELSVLFYSFMQKARADSRIGLSHITLYMAQLSIWYERNGAAPLYLFSREVKPLCKLAGPATYHRSIRQLHEYKYIRYVASNNHSLGSSMKLRDMRKINQNILLL